MSRTKQSLCHARRDLRPAHAARPSIQKAPASVGLNGAGHSAAHRASTRPHVDGSTTAMPRVGSRLPATMKEPADIAAPHCGAWQSPAVRSRTWAAPCPTRSPPGPERPNGCAPNKTQQRHVVADEPCAPTVQPSLGPAHTHHGRRTMGVPTARAILAAASGPARHRTCNGTFPSRDRSTLIKQRVDWAPHGNCYTPRRRRIFATRCSGREPHRPGSSAG